MADLASASWNDVPCSLIFCCLDAYLSSYLLFISAKKRRPTNSAKAPRKWEERANLTSTEVGALFIQDLDT